MKKSKKNKQNILIRTKDYFVGVIYQARKVRWPSRNELYISTIVVITFCACFAVFLGVAGQLIRYMFEALGMKG